ncbi:Hsp70 family protein [Planctomicrobium piriforme]|uniref:Hsp70 protein n=1 Tax=Planctomicrobium piriforme TaxID=1576369 RepID=A0A1I3TBI0_9PLAN|nr:Hsp70 family protein [Planctomicrobium piriforme]SFJ67081.1 Hsp70 protein [Planctomicrobium piriforme]
MSAEYVVGIDLGTTNSVVAFCPAQAEFPQIELLPVPQLVGPGTLETRGSLPSFLYLAPQEDAAFALPWAKKRDYVVGDWARRQSAENPDRTVIGAKSWLCYSRVDRRQPILPWNAPAEVAKISPVTASQRFLEHLVAAWNQQHPKAPLTKQRVVLTVPASFDASARELTREAALAAGLPEDFILLEEPQAAVYSWLAQAGERWRKLVKVGDTILVVDVGGGTTDLTLVSVAQEQGELELRRVAVGDHLLVGGDNMDLALAHHAAAKFAEKGTQLDPWQSVALWHACRTAKESLLSADGAETHPVAVLGRGRKLVGGTVTVDLDRTSTQQLLLDGFLPECDLQATVQRRRASGFQQIGLPFETETGVTRHIADFLKRHAAHENAVRPTDILVNGGVFKSDVLQSRLLQVLAGWFPQAPPKALAGERDLDHAVARGATYYGWAKDHGGVRIRGGTARSYYVGIETSGLAIPGAPRPLQALCVVPRGMEEGTQTNVPSGEFGLVVGEPAQFQFFSSAVRKEDKPGDLLRSWGPEELVETDPLEATLPVEEGNAGGYVPVTFQSAITELGIFELWCVNAGSQRKWKLEFSVREPEE